MLEKIKRSGINNGNLFAELMETVKYCSLGQITHAFMKWVGNTGEICKLFWLMA